MAAISGTRRAGASAGLVLLVAACGPPKGIVPGAAPDVAAPVALPPMPLGQVFVLEASGVQPEDTTVKVPSGQPRVVVIRRSAPDYGVFARIAFPAGSLTAPGGEATIRVSPRPSLFALDLETGGTVAAGATIEFSYGAHFVAPAGARERYGSVLAFEHALAIGRLERDTVFFLPTARPGSDIVHAPVSGPGRYLVAAPR